MNKVTKHIGYEGAVYWHNSETGGDYLTKSDALLAPRLEKAMNSGSWTRYVRKVEQRYDNEWYCPACKKLMTGMHMTYCKRFLRMLRKEAVEEYEEETK